MVELSSEPVGKSGKSQGRDDALRGTQLESKTSRRKKHCRVVGVISISISIKISTTIKIGPTCGRRSSTDHHLRVVARARRPRQGSTQRGLCERRRVSWSLRFGWLACVLDDMATCHEFVCVCLLRCCCCCRVFLCKCTRLCEFWHVLSQAQCQQPH